MSTKVYLDLVRRPPQGGKGRATLLSLQFPRMSRPIRIFFFSIMTSENTFVTETEASEKNLDPALGPLM